MKRDQTLTDPSSEPDTSSESSSENTRQETALKWARHFLSSLPVSTLQEMQATQHSRVNRNIHKLIPSPYFQFITLNLTSNASNTAQYNKHKTVTDINYVSVINGRWPKVKIPPYRLTSTAYGTAI